MRSGHEWAINRENPIMGRSFYNSVHYRQEINVTKERGSYFTDFVR